MEINLNSRIFYMYRIINVKKLFKYFSYSWLNFVKKVFAVEIFSGFSGVWGSWQSLPSKKESIKLDRIGKNNHLSPLEIDQRKTKIREVFMLEKQWNFGKEQQHSLASLPGAVPTVFSLLGRVRGFCRTGAGHRTTPGAACMGIGAGRSPMKSQNQGRLECSLNFECVPTDKGWKL